MKTATPRTAASVRPAENDLYRIGGIAGIASGILGIVANAAHPRLGSGELGETEPFMKMISDYSLWRIDHLAVVGAVVLGLVALVALGRSMMDGPAASWAHLAYAFALATGAVAAASFSIDGFVMANVASDWASADGPAKAAALDRAGTLEHVDGALFSMGTMGFFGVTQLLFGVAFRLSGDYPGWIATSAIVGGIAGFVSGAWMWLAGGLNTGNFLVLFTLTSVVLTAWLIAASLRLYRRSKGDLEPA